MSIDKSKFLEAFCAEAQDYILILNNGLVKLEEGADDEALLKELFRVAHTLKGSARMMGFNQMQLVAHKLEDTFSGFKEGKLTFDGSIAKTVFSALDLISSALSNLLDGKGEGIEVNDIVQAIDSACSGESIPKNDQVAGVEQEKNSQKEEVSSEKSTTPQETISTLVDKSDYIRIPVSQINQLLNLIGELVINKVKTPYRVASLKKIYRATMQLNRMLGEVTPAVKEAFGIPDEIISKKGVLLRASQEFEQAATLLDSLHKLESFSGNINTIVKSVFDSMQSELLHLNPVIEDLQRKMKEIRMLPCSTIFAAFPRLVRDVASQQGKRVKLEIIGEDTQLDKKVLQLVKGPLIHLLRNAVDHGIETMANRQEKGKNKVGTIILSATQSGDRVILQIEDDGKGIDVEAIKAQALKKEIVSIEELKKMNEQAIINLIYKSGFSTAKFVTDISGRGVGLDVVSADIETLKGTLLTESTEGAGSKFTLSLPLTIAVARVLIVGVDKMRFAFPTINLSEIVKVKMEDVSTIERRMVVCRHGQTLPLVALSKLLGMSEKTTTSGQKKLSVVVVNYLDEMIGIVVDRINSDEEVFVKNIGTHLGKVDGVSGGAILPNGEVLVILDISNLLDVDRLRNLTYSAVKKVKMKIQKKRILIVDDSLTTRELEKVILEKGGYEVETAIDGLDGLEKVDNNHYDLIVSDIQMPRMDGFEFCNNVRTNDKFKHIPLIFVTALAKDEEKRRGIKVGAQAYITKGQFDQTVLLETIERLI